MPGARRDIFIIAVSNCAGFAIGTLSRQFESEESMNFQISALGYEQFAPLFGLPDEALAARFAIRRVATAKPGFPCRVSLADA